MWNHFYDWPLLSIILISFSLTYSRNSRPRSVSPLTTASCFRMVMFWSCCHVAMQSKFNKDFGNLCIYLLKIRQKIQPPESLWFWDLAASKSRELRFCGFSRWFSWICGAAEVSSVPMGTLIDSENELDSVSKERDC